MFVKAIKAVAAAKEKLIEIGVMDVIDGRVVLYEQ